MDASLTLARLAQLREDFPLFCRECLRIRDKSGKIVPLVLNPVQQLVHELLEKQKREKGWVRALILKARQPGISTYIAARYYHRSSLFGGTNTYILSHAQDASDNLFGIVDRYQRHNPIKPHIGTANVKELEFDLIDSSYAVATAGQKAAGRGRSTTLFHGSEVAFWPNASDHFAASVQTVPLMPGTEVVLESTAYGPSGEFYERCLDAEAERGDYMRIFIPWQMTEEYSREPDVDFVLNPEGTADVLSETEYAAMHSLSLNQMAWRRNKIIELRSEEKFQQEYPATPQEAFVAAGFESFIAATAVLRARKRKMEGYGPLVIGVDPASLGGDRFSICARRGNTVEWIKYRTKVDPMVGIAWVRSIIDEFDPARVNIDAGNIGYAIVSGLRSIGPKYVEKIRSINFGGTAEQKIAKPKVPGPGNRRAEMWQRMRDWLALPEGVSIPDLDMLQSDLTAPKLKPRANHDFLVESKQEMKARNVRSPDLADSLALTFALNEFIEKYTQPQAVPAYGDIDAPRSSAVQRPSIDPGAAGGGSHGWMAF